LASLGASMMLHLACADSWSGRVAAAASELLRLVEQGETIEVINHGRVVDVLRPPPD